MAPDKTQNEQKSDVVNHNYQGEHNIETTKIIIEQYKLYIEMADKISERRQNANSFFLSLCTAFMGALGYLLIEKNQNAYTNILWLPPLFGILVSYSWYRLIRSYKDLNSGKFMVIHQIEQKLPIKPYDAEWETIGKGRNKKLYLPFTHIEIFLPWIFLISFLIILLINIPWKLIFHIS